MREEVLRLENIIIKENDVALLNNFNLHIFQGEIMGMVCVNSLGRDLLVNLICQNIPLVYGRVYLNENLVNSYEHSNYTMNKVSVIEKKSKLVKDLTVSDNIFVLRRGFKKYIISPRVLNKQLKMFLKDLEVTIDGNELIMHLSSFNQCVVELLKAVVLGVKIVIIKDLSNFISAADLIKFHALIRYFSQKGISFLYICNHHEEAFKICDRLSIFENGKIQKIFESREFKRDKIKPFYKDIYSTVLPDKSDKSYSETILEWKHISTENMKDISLTINKGECAVLLDMNNTILHDVVDIMTGSQKPLSGDILIDGIPLRKRRKSKLNRSICFINENPAETMLFPEMSYFDNLCFLLQNKMNKSLLRRKIRKSIEREYAGILGEDFYHKDINTLSLHSKYNLIFYRIYLYHPQVVFFIQPFYHADLYLRKHIIELMNILKKRGITLVILAVNIADSLMVADRMLVIEQGRMTKEYRYTEFYKLNEEATIL